MQHTGDSSGAYRDGFAADIAAARGGCEQALNRLFAACRPYLLTVANQSLPDELRAKLGGSDLVQDTLMQVRGNFARFHGSTEQELLAWLRGALLNNVHAQTRRYLGTQKREARREVSLDQGLSGAEHEGLVDGAAWCPDCQVLADEEAIRLNASLERLSADYRRVIELRNWEGRPFTKIGEAMGRSPEAARKLWARAIEQLRVELKAS